MLCEDCRQFRKTLYWVDDIGSLVCKQCLPRHVKPAVGTVVMLVRSDPMRLETKTK